MQVKPKDYKKDFSYSYASGVFATLELLKNRPWEVIRVFLNPGGKGDKGLNEIQQLCDKYKIPVEKASGIVIKLTHSENTYAVGVFKKYQTNLNPDDNHLMLVNPQDMGNIGTIIRTMVGFNVKNLAIIRPGADIYDPKVIRSSTGAFFKINFEYFSNFEDYSKKFPRNYYTFTLNAQKELSKVQFEKPFTLIFGNENTGLSREFEKVGTSVKINHSKEIESLNLGISVGVVLYSTKIH